MREYQRRNEHFLWGHEQRHGIHGPARGNCEQQRRVVNRNIDPDRCRDSTVNLRPDEHLAADDQRHGDRGHLTLELDRNLERHTHDV